MGCAGISGVWGRGGEKVGRQVQLHPTVTGHLQALPGKGLTSLLLSLLLCKMGLIIIPASQGQLERGSRRALGSVGAGVPARRLRLEVHSTRPWPGSRGQGD